MLQRSIYLTDEIKAFQEQTVAFIDKEVKPHAEKWELDGKVPRQVLRQMGAIGFFGLQYPEEYGGVDAGAVATAAFAEALGTSTFAGFAITVLVHTDMASPHLFHQGSDSQKERFARQILAGETITAVAISEPDAGSDVAGLRTTAIKDGDGWRINGSKMFITNGVYGDLFMVAARTNPELSGAHGISMFMVESGTDGFTVGRKLEKMGWRCSDTAELIFQDCWIPDENLLGEKDKGFYAVMDNFQNERLVIGAMAVGEAQTALDLTYVHTQNRTAFGTALFEKQAIRQRLAMLQARVDAARQLVYHTAWLVDQGDKPTREVSEIKALCGELVNDVMYDCLQFHGGMGFIQETAIERMYRDARVQAIGGGATEVMLEEVAKRSYVD